MICGSSDEMGASDVKLFFGAWLFIYLNCINVFTKLIFYLSFAPQILVKFVLKCLETPDLDSICSSHILSLNCMRFVITTPSGVGRESGQAIKIRKTGISGKASF